MYPQLPPSGPWYRTNLSTPGLPRAAYDEHQRSGYAWSDTYDARKVFDDVYDSDGAAEPVDIIRAAGEVVRKLKKRRLRTPPANFEIVGNDTTVFTFEPVNHVIGADESIPAGKATLFDKLRDLFRVAIGKPKLVRIDDEESYTEFRDRRRQPHITTLDDRLVQLEQAFVDHVSDGHGGFADVEAFDRYLDGGRVPDGYDDAYVALIANAARGGERVNLGLPRSMRGKIECWRDGDEILLSVRLANGIVTTGCSIDDHFAEVVHTAEIVGCCGEDALIVGAKLAPAVAGTRLLNDICRVGATLSEVRGTCIGVLRPSADPGLAAMMGLLQRCQQGDKQALREAHKLAAHNFDLVRRAGERLTQAQAQKAKRIVGMDAKEFGTNFYGGAHTGGKIIMTAFGAGAVVDMLDPVTKPALPGWAGGTADKKPEVNLPPPTEPKAARAKAIVVVVAPDATLVVHKSGTVDVISTPDTVGVLGGTRIKGNGYKKGDTDKFSFGFEAPQAVTVSLKGKKTTDTDVKAVLFQGGKAQAPVIVGGLR